MCPQEMTEEGLPLLILFYHPEEPEVKDMFRQRVEAELAEHKGTCDSHMTCGNWRVSSDLIGWCMTRLVSFPLGSINCVTANGVTFSHPLHHLGKGAKVRHSLLVPPLPLLLRAQSDLLTSAFQIGDLF